MKGKVFYFALIAFVTLVLSSSAQVKVITEEAVWNQLKDLSDSYLGTPLSVVDMGLIYGVKVNNNDVHILLTTYHEGFVDIMRVASPVRKKILAMPGVGNVSVELLWPPPWTPARLSKKARDFFRYEPGDPVEGKLHVRSKVKAAADTKADDERKLDRSHLVIPAAEYGTVNTLPGTRLNKWRNWRYFKRFEVEETYGVARKGEPVFVDAAFSGGQIKDYAKEIRVIEEQAEKEIPCQIIGQTQDGKGKKCTVVFLSDIAAKEKKGYVLLFGNSSPDLQMPYYPTDIVTHGMGYSLDIENSYYKAYLSPRMGHLKRVQFKQGGKTIIGYPTDEYPPPTIIDASNDPGDVPLDLVWHGEDWGLHHNPDFSELVRFRVTFWSKPPHYTVEKGPICTIVKRWGYPIPPMYPAFAQNNVSIEVTYVFYSGLPYFTIESRINVEKETDIRVIRNDQMTLLPVFTDMFSMMDGGEIISYPEKSGNVSFDKNPAVMGHYNRTNGDGFASLELAFDARGFPGAYGKNSCTLMNDINAWVRWAFYSDRVKSGLTSIGIQPGSTVGEYNAYLLYNINDPGGNDQARDWYNLLRHPLKPRLAEKSR
jgi:metal-sulfur cluster biosynthetic enzyme